MHDRRATVEITVNGQQIEAYEGETVMQAAGRNDIRIPSLCYLEGLSTWGACRLCVVEVSESRGLSPACATGVREDLQVITDSPRLRRHRRVRRQAKPTGPATSWHASTKSVPSTA